MEDIQQCLEAIRSGQQFPLRALYRHYRADFLAATPQKKTRPALLTYQIGLVNRLAEWCQGQSLPEATAIVPLLLEGTNAPPPTTANNAVDTAFDHLAHDAQHTVELLFYRRYLERARKEVLPHLDGTEFYQLLSDAMRQLLAAHTPALLEATSEDLQLTQQYFLAGLPPSYQTTYDERLAADPGFKALHDGMQAVVSYADQRTREELLEILQDEERRIRHPFRAFVGRNLTWILLVTLLVIGLVAGVRACGS